MCSVCINSLFVCSLTVVRSHPLIGFPKLIEFVASIASCVTSILYECLHTCVYVFVCRSVFCSFICLFKIRISDYVAMN